MDKATETVISIGDLKQDDLNANRGTARGTKMLLDSLKKFGAGRSILIDKNNKIIAGNKTAEQAAAAGITKVRVIDSDGTKVVAVKRSNLNIDDPDAQALALYDNRVAQVNLEWDGEAFMKLREQNAKLEQFFLDHELSKIENRPMPQMDDESNETQGDEGAEKSVGAVTRTALEQLFFDVESFLKFEEVMTRLEEFFQTEGNTDTIMAAMEYVNANTGTSDQTSSDVAG